MASLQEELKKRERVLTRDERIYEQRDQNKRDREQLNKIRQKHIASEKNSIKADKELGLRKTDWKSRRAYAREGRTDHANLPYNERIAKAREYADREFDTLQANKKVEADRQKAIDEQNWADFNKWESLVQSDEPLKYTDFQEKENLFKKFAGQENFIKEKIWALSDIIENETTDDATRKSLIYTLEQIAASHNQFKEAQQDTYAMIEKEKRGELRGEEIFTNQEDIDRWNIERGFTTPDPVDPVATEKQPKGVNEVSSPDDSIGAKGNPWQRKSLMDSPKLANEATERILTKQGYDLRGLGIAQKQDLFSDYRLGRLQETDKGLFFNNKLLRKR
tara:strand:+ start:13 stop:1017 length:1005 start_codon:yes stop_codon:yes gene_type:complete